MWKIKGGKMGINREMGERGLEDKLCRNNDEWKPEIGR